MPKDLIEDQSGLFGWLVGEFCARENGAVKNKTSAPRQIPKTGKAVLSTMNGKLNHHAVATNKKRGTGFPVPRFLAEPRSHERGYVPITASPSCFRRDGNLPRHGRRPLPSS